MCLDSVREMITKPVVQSILYRTGYRRPFTKNQHAHVDLTCMYKSSMCHTRTASHLGSFIRNSAFYNGHKIVASSMIWLSCIRISNKLWIWLKMIPCYTTILNTFNVSGGITNVDKKLWILQNFISLNWNVLQSIVSTIRGIIKWITKIKKALQNLSKILYYLIFRTNYIVNDP